MAKTSPIVSMTSDAAFSLLAGGFHCCDPSWDKAADGLDQCYKLYLPIRGGARLTLADGPVSLEAGCGYFLPGYFLKGQKCPERMEIYWLHFQPESLYWKFLLSHVARVHVWRREAVDYWASVWKELPALFPSPLGDRSDRRGRENGRSKAKRQNTVDQLFHRVQAMLMDLVSEVLATYRLDHLASVDPGFERLRPAIEFMERHLLENPRLAEIARAAHLAPNYFHRKFSTVFHVSPKGYMLARRLNLARQLLQGTDLTLRQIAERTGFCSEFHFSKAFKNYAKLSPKQFRSQSLP